MAEIPDPVPKISTNDYSVQDYLNKVKAGEIDVVAYVQKALKKAQEYDQEYHFFTTICAERALQQAKEIQLKVKHKTAGRLAGLLISVKDNICVQGVESTAGSRILKGYTPLFNATAIERLEQEDAIIIGKTTQDAFGFGSFNINVGLGNTIPCNPLDVRRTTGGSSGGAAGMTAAADFVHVALAESTGGSVEAPASFCGVVGFCPTYGKISRYGLISYADSLDKIGIMSRNVEDIAPVLEVVSGFDEMDGTSLADDSEHNAEMIPEKMKSMNRTNRVKGAKEVKKTIRKIGVLNNSFDKNVSPAIQAALREIQEKLREKGCSIKEVSLPITSKYGIAAYYILSTAEASTNLTRFCGLRYGQEASVKGKSFSEYFTEIRSKHFNEESKRRIILGTFTRMAGYRDAYYLKAAKARSKIIAEYKKLFETYDLLISPTMPLVAPTFAEIGKLTPLQHYLMDVLTVGPNLAGIPHASIPIGFSENMPIGLMVMADHREEEKLLQFLALVETAVQKQK